MGTTASAYQKCLTLLVLAIVLIPLKASAGMMSGTLPNGTPNDSVRWNFFWTNDTADFVVSGSRGIFGGGGFNVMSIVTDDGAWEATVAVQARSGVFDDELHVDLTLQHLFAVHPDQGDQCCGGIFSYDPSLSNLTPGIADLPLTPPVHLYRDPGKIETLAHPSVHLDMFEGMFAAGVEVALSSAVPGAPHTHRITGFDARVRAVHNVGAPSTVALAVIGFSALAFSQRRRRCKTPRSSDIAEMFADKEHVRAGN